MAGTIIIRYNRADGMFHAKPTFSCPGMAFDAPKPEEKWTDPWMAFSRLCHKLPEPIRSQAMSVDKWRMYRAPEYINYLDMCVDIDGHKPTRDEWARRRANFLSDVKMGRQTF